MIKRFLAIFYPAAQFLVTTRITYVENETFKTEGKVMINSGWRVVYGQEIQMDDADENSALVLVKPGSWFLLKK